jgi:hypothetical protein
MKFTSNCAQIPLGSRSCPREEDLKMNIRPIMRRPGKPQYLIAARQRIALAFASD